MSISQWFFASTRGGMHLSSDALNRVVHHESPSGMGRSEPSRVPGANVRLVCIVDVHGRFRFLIARASCSFQRDNRAMVHGSGGQAAPARSKIATLTHIESLAAPQERQSSMRIVQDTANIQEPRCGKHFPLAWWNTQKSRPSGR